MLNIELSIEIADNANIILLEQRLYNAIANEISPEIRFYSLKELLDKDFKVEDIFDGPSLDQGFLDDDELLNLNNNDKVCEPDIISVILNVKDVKKVREIFIKAENRNKSAVMNICENERLRVGTVNVNFYKHGQFYCTKNLEYKELKTGQLSYKTQDNAQDNDIPLPLGNYRNLKDYISICEDLPCNYYVGKNNKPSSKINSQRAEMIEGLKGYLLFFDQILANYFAQLDGVKQLFNHIDDFASDHHKTYFTQLVKDLNLESLVSKDYEQELAEIVVNNCKTLDKQSAAISGNIRKNLLLDYLLGIFGEKFNDYSGLLEKRSDNNLNIDLIGTQEKLIKKKIAHLKKYDKISRDRNKAANYLDNNQDLSYPLERFIANLLGISEDVQNNDKKIYIVEHILLRPVRSNLHYEEEKGFFVNSTVTDPYSCMLSVIISGDIVTKTDNNQKQEIQKIIDREIAAHLIVNYRWLEQQEFNNFKKLYDKWKSKFLSLVRTTKNKIEDENKTLNLSRNLIRFLLNIEGKNAGGGIGYMAIKESSDIQESPDDSPDYFKVF